MREYQTKTLGLAMEAGVVGGMPAARRQTIPGSDLTRKL